MAGDKQHTATRPAGYAVAVGPDGKQEADTLQCGHCGGHFLVRPGSGKLRGHCYVCHKITCGPTCIIPLGACVPQELLCENIEKGRPIDFRPISVSNPGLSG